MKRLSMLLLFFLVFAVDIATVQGGYSVEPFSPVAGPSDTSGADSTITFFELPLWIQLSWIISSFLAIFGMIKFGPLLIGKIRDIVQNKNRSAILEYIGNNPGCTIADLSKNTGINRGTARYYLCLLLVEQKVVRKKDGKQGYLFANGGKQLGRKRVRGYIMNPAKREILNTILTCPGISNKEIAERLHFDPSTIHWHLQQFLDEEMILSRWDGRNMNYVLLPEVEDILREYRK